MSPRAVVNGVYRIGCDESALMAQLLDYYGKALSTYPVEVSTFVERVIPVVLMDVTISDADERFNMAEFTQEMPSAPREIWQVPYDEALLSEDGSEVVARWPGCAENIGAGRIGFYFHFYDPDRPMRWTYGVVPCPTPQPISDRLVSLLPYEPI